MADSRDLPAGEFSAWLRGIRAALAGGTETDVPCGDCSACCTTSHFVHVDRGETDALARIPAELLFPAPGAPAGTKLMGYDRGGRCPMLGGDLCSIYATRSRSRGGRGAGDSAIRRPGTAPSTPRSAPPPGSCASAPNASLAGRSRTTR